jgi:hypothetical protein
MAAKKTGGINKSAFVRSLPDSMKAKDVVAKAKEQGFTLSEKHVHTIRSEARRAASKGRGGAKRGPGRPRGVRAAAPAARRTLTAHGDGVEAQLVALISEYGLRKVGDAIGTIRDRIRHSLV